MALPEHFLERIRHGLHLGQALRLVWQCARGLTIANATLVVFQGALPILQLYLLKLIVDQVTAAVGASDKAAAFGKVLFLVVLTGLASLVGALSRALAEIIKEAQGQVVSDHVTGLIHAKSVAVDLAYFENPGYYDTLHRAQQEAAFRPIRLLDGLLQLGQNGLILAGLTGLLLTFHWAVAGILFAATVPGLILRLSYARQMYDWQRQQTQSERWAYYFHFLLTDGGPAKEVRLFGLGSLLRGRFRDIRERLRKERLRITTRRSLTELVAQGVGILAIFGTLGFIAHQTIQGAITLGDMVMFFGAFQRAQGSLNDLLANLSRLYEDNLFLANFQEFLELKPKIAEPPHPQPFPRPLRDGIVFDQVSFQYPAGASPALSEISLHIPPGSLVALVGENGSGKTTLAKLLCRLYDPIQGRILVDGIDLREFATQEVRRHISVIFQDYVRYNLSARENIWLGDIEVPPGSARVEAAAQQTGADRAIRRLPRRYETILGHWFEDQGELSTGEWQKVALARTLLRRSQIIILDEPTSWLDARAEYEVFRSFRQEHAGQTTILISHRFSTIRLADCIYVLEGGRVIEQGSHHDLLRQAGRYAELFELQAASLYP